MRGTALTVVFAVAMLLAFGARAEEGLVTVKILKVKTALVAARAALAECRKQGYQVSVAVVDRFGNVQVLLRDRYAGPHTAETARRKAWTAVSFRTDTLAMAATTQAGKPQSGARQIPGALMLGGGVPIEAAGSIVGGLGVSGAPGGKADDGCVRAGIEAIQDQIAF